MNIVHTVEFYYPSTGGSQEVVRQLSERLVELGHTVTVATTKLPERKSLVHNGVKIVEFAIEGNEVRGYKGETEKYRQFIRNGEFDVIMNYAAQQWASDLVYDILPELKARKVFVPCGFSGLYLPEYAEYFKRMPEVLRRYDATIYLSHNYQDTIFAQQHGVKNIVIIPNGADEQEFMTAQATDIRHDLAMAPNQKLVMHLGSFTGQKGQPEALRIFIKARLKDTTLLIVGNIFNVPLYRRCKLYGVIYNLLPRFIRRNCRVIVTSLSRQMTVDALKAADVFLFPSNIEASPLVLFEACAAKTPFLTTDVGNAKELIAWTKGGMLLPGQKDNLGLTHADISGSASMLKKLLSNPRKLHQLAKHGYIAWKQKFTWGKITQQYLKVYEGVMS